METLQQEIKRIGTALRTHDGTVLAEYGGFNRLMTYSMWRGHCCCRSRGDRVNRNLKLVEDILTPLGIPTPYPASIQILWRTWAAHRNGFNRVHCRECGQRFEGRVG